MMMNKLSKVVAIAAVSVWGMQAMAASAPATQKIAVVNVQQVLEASPRVKALNDGLRDKFKPEQTALEAQQKSLQAAMDKLKRERSVMTKEQIATAEGNVKKDQEAFVEKASAFQKSLQAAQQDVMKTVFDSMSDVIATVAKKDGYDLVIDNQAVTYSADNINISDEVAKAFNSAK